MKDPLMPVVTSEIWQRFPSYRALSVNVGGFAIAGQESDFVPVALEPLALKPPDWLEEHLEAWRGAFRAFGANPKKTSCSAEALWKRVQKNGELPVIDPVVDLYNSLSIRFGAPFGGEDAACYDGVPQLGLAAGTEDFDTMKDGAPVVERPEPGEVIWRDNRGVTCRRWNWRQCKRTALTSASRDLWFVIDRLEPMPLDELYRAGDELVKGLQTLCPKAEAYTKLLEP